MERVDSRFRGNAGLARPKTFRRDCPARETRPYGPCGVDEVLPTLMVGTAKLAFNIYNIVIIFTSLTIMLNLDINNA